jgi:hypothetical protein
MNKLFQKKNMKGFVLDIALIFWIFVVCAALVMITFSLMWLKTRQYLSGAIAPYNSTLVGTPLNPQTVLNLGNNYFLQAGDTIIIFFTFMLILAAFISARQEGSDSSSFPIGLLFLVVALIISFPISDFSHALLNAAQILSASAYYKGTLYLTDNMPIIVAVGTAFYLVLVITNKKKPSFPSVSGGGNAGVISG